MMVKPCFRSLILFNQIFYLIGDAVYKPSIHYFYLQFEV